MKHTTGALLVALTISASGTPATLALPAADTPVVGTDQLTETEVTADSRALVELSNKLREKNDLAALAHSIDLNTVAQRWADKMASGEVAYGHNDDVAEEVPQGWTRIGENVAYRSQASVTAMFQQWANSPGHAKNLMGEYTHMGAAVAISDDGMMYGVQVFGEYPFGDLDLVPEQDDETEGDPADGDGSESDDEQGDGQNGDDSDDGHGEGDGPDDNTGDGDGSDSEPDDSDGDEGDDNSGDPDTDADGDSDGETTPDDPSESSDEDDAPDADDHSEDETSDPSDGGGDSEPDTDVSAESDADDAPNSDDDGPQGASGADNPTRSADGRPADELAPEVSAGAKPESDVQRAYPQRSPSDILRVPTYQEEVEAPAATESKAQQRVQAPLALPDTAAEEDTSVAPLIVEKGNPTGTVWLALGAALLLTGVGAGAAVAVNPKLRAKARALLTRGK